MKSSQTKEREFAKILLYVNHLGFLKHFEKTIHTLTNHGHLVTVLFGSNKKENFASSTLRRLKNNPKVKFNFIKEEKFIKSTFQKDAQFYRAWIDHLHYQNEIFYGVPELRNRFPRPKKTTAFSAEIVVASLNLDMSEDKVENKIQLLTELYSGHLVPSQKIKNYMKKGNFDIILLTPFVDGNSSAHLLNKFAKESGLPSIYLMASWDNLQNKGVARPSTDLSLVWTNYHKDILKNLHGVDESTINVVGSEVLETWRKSIHTNDENEITRTNKYLSNILYLASSAFVGGKKEEDFLVSLLEHLEIHSPEPIHFTIKEHPQFRLERLRSYRKTNLQSRIKYEVVSSKENIVDNNKSQINFVQMVREHDITMGINTTAMLEACLLGSPIVSVSPTFENHNFNKTLHYEFLNRYVSYCVNSRNEFIELLDKIVEIKEKAKTKKVLLENEIQIDDFTSAEDRIYAEIMSSLKNKKESNNLESSRSSVFKNRWRYLGDFFIQLPRRIMKFGLILRRNGIMGIRDHFFLFLKNQKFEFEQSKYLSYYEVSRNNNLKMLEIEHHELINENRSRKKLRIDSLFHESRKYKFRDQKTYEIYLRDVTGLLSETIKNAEKVIVGPWFSELGFEVLYWIPFLNNLFHNASLPPERIISISRSGTSELYSPISHHNVNALELFDSEQWTVSVNENWKSLGGLKQSTIGRFDKEILKKVFDSDELINVQGDCLLIHPSLLFSLFRPFWRNKDFSIDSIEFLLRFPEYKYEPQSRDLLVKMYERPSFEMNQKSKVLIEETLKKILTPISVITDDSYADDHGIPTLKLPEHAKKIQVSDFKTNLYEQIKLINRSRTCLMTYGGLSYVSLIYGVPCVALLNKPNEIVTQHLSIAQALARARNVEYSVVDTRHATTEHLGDLLNSFLKSEK